MTPEIEKIINDYINSPTGTIKQIYPIIDKINLKYNSGPNNSEWLMVSVYLNTYIENKRDLWDIHLFDWVWMMDQHIINKIFKLFDLKKLPYELNVYGPKDNNPTSDSQWKYITGSGGLMW